MNYVSRSRSLPILGASIAAVVLLTGIPAVAQTIGSSLVSRGQVDTSAGQVLIYAGGSFTSGSTVSTFGIFDNISSGSVMTPLLFEQTTSGVFAVRGVGTGRTITASASPQSFGFGLQQGTALASNGNFTFGYINALVNAAGTQTVNGAGTVELQTSQQSGDGISGPGSTNRWIFTNSTPSLSVALGTTYFLPGNSGDFLVTGDRTYSATATANTAANTPEPGSIALLVGLGLSGSIFLKHRKRNRL